MRLMEVSVMRKGNGLIGLLLIAAGAIILVLRSVFGIKIFDFSTSDFWVFIVLLIGIGFELGYFLSGSKSGLLIPGGIITTIGLLFMFEVSTDWNFAEYTWPVYILSFAIGLLQMYMFSNIKYKGLLISGLIVGGIGAFCLVCTIFSGITNFINPGLLIPIALIAGGIAIFCSSSANRKSQY